MPVPGIRGIDASRPLVSRLRVSLIPHSRLEFAGQGGQALHGLFLAILAHWNLDLAGRLHDETDNKQFSLSPLTGGRCLQGKTIVQAMSPVYFEAGLLNTAVAVAAASAFYEASLDSLELSLGKVAITVPEVASASPDGVWRYYDELFEDAALDREITLEFLSPTAFKVRGNNFPFPLPELVFSSLLRHWNAFSGIPLPQSLEASFASILVSRYELRSEIVAFPRFKWIGGKGRVTFLLPAPMTSEMVKAINCLADLAFYSGVGGKTTMGMGQTRRQHNARSLPDRAGGHPEKTRRPGTDHQG